MKISPLTGEEANFGVVLASLILPHTMRLVYNTWGAMRKECLN